MKDTGNCTFSVDSGAKEGFQNPRPPAAAGGLPGMSRPMVVNNVSPSLAPPFAGSGCDLDCTKPEVMKAVKQKYEAGANVEGYRNYTGGRLASLREAFQDGGEEVAEDGGEMEADTTDPSSYNEPAQITAEEQQAVAAVMETPPPKKVVASTTLKKVNRALRTGVDKCEYEIVFDAVAVDSSGGAKETKDGIGFFQATFSKDKVGCAYMPSQVVKVAAPIIPGVPAARVSNVSFSL
jgi:hypothetical protein